MKNRSTLLLLLASFMLFVASCDDDHNHDHNVVTITVQEPTNNEMIAIADCASVHIHADFAASIELHEVKVELHPENDPSDLILDFEMHTHDQTYTFDQEVDLCSYPSGTTFHLHLEAYLDHDGAETVTEEVEFTLQ